MNNAQKTNVSGWLFPKTKATVSAEVVTAFRAVGVYDAKIKNPDNLAINFLGPKYQIFNSLAKRMHFVFKRAIEQKVPGCYWYFQARTKHFDTVFLDAIEKGIEQCVFLGAGYDTRPYRFSGKLKDISIFEVDLPRTQERKIKILESVSGSVPENITYVPINFNTQSIKNQLAVNGYDPNKKTLFIWEGVSYYLPESSVNSVLEFVKEFSPPGSYIVFDYVLRSALEGNYKSYGSKELVENWEKMGEPGLFGIKDGATEQFLKEKGLEIISDFGPDLLEQHYCTDGDGKKHGRVWGCMNIVCAQI